MHAFLSIQLLLSVFFHSAVVCHPVFCYAADACHFTFCHATVTFPFVIQLLVTSSSSHPAAFHSSVIHAYVCHLLLLSSRCLSPLNSVTEPAILYLQSIRLCLSFHNPFLHLSASPVSFLSYDVPVTFPFAIQKPVTPLYLSPFCLSALFLISRPFVSLMQTNYILDISTF
jgi:hypothetical protein